MKSYYLNFAGNIIKMQTENEITITEKLAPFLLREVPVKVDCLLDVHACEQLPEYECGGYWRGTTYYVYHGKEPYVFYVDKAGEPPFAVTWFRKDGNVTLLYLKKYAHYFTGSSRIFNKIGAEQLLIQHNRLMLHASFVKYKGHGILFSGPSGIGKSTQAELWRRTRGAEIVNGDRVAVGLVDEEWIAWGIPYAGTSGICHNKSAHISAIVILRQANNNQIRSLSAIEAMRYLYPETTVHQWDAKFVEKVTCLLSQHISAVPVFLLECVPDESAVEILQEKLTIGAKAKT